MAKRESGSILKQSNQLLVQDPHENKNTEHEEIVKFLLGVSTNSGQSVSFFKWGFQYIVINTSISIQATIHQWTLELALRSKHIKSKFDAHHAYFFIFCICQSWGKYCVVSLTDFFFSHKVIPPKTVSELKRTGRTAWVSWDNIHRSTRVVQIHLVHGLQFSVTNLWPVVELGSLSIICFYSVLWKCIIIIVKLELINWSLILDQSLKFALDADWTFWTIWSFLSYLVFCSFLVGNGLTHPKKSN